MATGTEKSCGLENCSQCSSRQQGVFGELADDALSLVDLGKSFLKVPKGKTLFQAGDLAQGLYCVGKGLVKTEVEGPHGETRILAVAAPGEFVGYTAIFNGGHQRATAIAVEDTELCFIPTETINGLIERHPEFARAFLTKVVHDVNLAQQRLLDEEKTSFQRVAEAILFLVGRFPDHKWTRKEISNWAGTATETAIRVLSEFADEQWVELQARRIVIKNREALLKLAEV